MQKLLQLNFLSLFAFIILCFTGHQALAQGVVSGTVTDADSDETLIGVNILIDELDLGMPTDAEGQFQFSNVPVGEYQLEARYIGFNTVQRSVTVADGEETVVNLEMTMSNAELDELVVTSFGLEQERKSLGYSVQEIDSENLTVGNQSNVVSALGGKVSGVQVTNTGGSPGSSSRI
ncbi:MAG: carboxypeptidase-like regulatory domain-containing protein, partial [Balneolaceae bacterium]